jgi:hypothetical protein
MRARRARWAVGAHLGWEAGLARALGRDARSRAGERWRGDGLRQARWAAGATLAGPCGWRGEAAGRAGPGKGAGPLFLFLFLSLFFLFSIYFSLTLCANN